MGIVRTEGDVDGAGIFVLVENFLPGFAAIGGAKNTALGIRAERMAQSRHKNNVSIPGIDNYLADGSRVVQADVLPCLPAVEGFINSVAMRDVAADAGLAGTDIDDIRVGNCHGETAD